VTVAPAVTLFADRGGVTRCPVEADWLLILGDEDEIVSPDAVLEWARMQPLPPVIERVPEAGHFFHGRLQQLREAVLRHVRCGD